MAGTRTTAHCIVFYEIVSLRTKVIPFFLVFLVSFFFFFHFFTIDVIVVIEYEWYST
jgi:hypothetical protein